MNEQITIGSLARVDKSENEKKPDTISFGAIFEFSPQERGRIEKIKKDLDLTDSITTVEFGIGCQRKLAEFAETG